MNKIVEEALTNLIRRVESLESKIKSPTTQNQSPGQATINQIRYIKQLGGDTHPEMTKREAGIEIDRLLQKKESDESDDNVEHVEHVDNVEPKEVDTEDAGLDSEGLI